MAFLKHINEAIFGPSINVELPPRVQSELIKQQYASEKLIGWMQLMVLIVFAIIYFSSGKSFKLHLTLTPVPCILVIYFMFSVVRLAFAYSGALLNWFLVLSVIADVSLLLILIWIFHIQYMQPLSFSLKSPTLMYVFIFIALRALRFEPLYVLMAGTLAAAGWAVIVLNAVFLDHGIITHDYVSYMTSNDILVGAEFDKIVCILLTTIILAVALVRGKRMLINAITKSVATEDLSRFFDPEVALAITGAKNMLYPGYGELCNAAILHCDIRGFTQITLDSTAEDAIKLLTEYQQRMVRIIGEHHGSVDKFLGDGILVSFGVITKSDTYAADALRTADALVAEAALWAQERANNHLNPIRIGIAVAIGQVVFGVVGDSQRMEYTVIGEPVNLAVKLDKQCKLEHCQILATQDCFALACAQGYKNIREPSNRDARVIDGVGEPVNLVVLASNSW